MNCNGCTITINPCQAKGWRGWWEYTVSNGRQSLEGRSCGTKREVVSDLKWRIDRNELFPVVAQSNTRLQADVAKAEMIQDMFDHVWFWRSRLPGRKGHVCRVLARGRMNSILVEFPDGYKVVTSRYAVRRLTMRAPDRWWAPAKKNESRI